MRSIPEKTLEHWASMYLARRFPTCQLWWPSKDEDIAVQSLTNRTGKSLLLEVKTTDWNRRRGEHRLTIDVDQLRRYQSSPVPVYYLFPMPPWPDVLADGDSWLMGRRRTELIERGHGWFGSWLFVVRAQTLWTWLGSKQTQKSATLFAKGVGPDDPSRVTPEPSPWWRWPKFWGEMARCGSQAMPSMFTLPSAAVPVAIDGSLSRDALGEILTSFRGDLTRDPLGDQVTRFVTDEGATYRPLAQSDVMELPLTAGAAGRSTALLHLGPADLDL